MKSDKFLDYFRNQFNVCDANMGKLPHRTRLIVDEDTGEFMLPMPKDIYGDFAAVDDVISFKIASKYRIKLINLS